MSDKASTWFQKHVQLIQECQKRVALVKMNLSGYKKRSLEVLSALMWVIMIMWFELLAIIVYFYIFVSFESPPKAAFRQVNQHIFRQKAEFLANFFASLMRLIGIQIESRRKMEDEAMGETLFSSLRISLKSFSPSIDRSEFIRNLSWFKHFSNFFPVKIIKTAELPPTTNYLFAIYPHGVIRQVSLSA